MRKLIAGRLAVFSSVLALALSTLMPAAHAAQATGSVVVSALVVANCSIATSPMVFGNYTNAQVDSSSAILVTCSVDTGWVLALDAGTGSGATVASRKMTGPVNGSDLGYSLFSDAPRSTVWGNTPGGNTVAGTGNGLVQSQTVYGRIPSGQFAAAGAYLDTVTATLTY